MKEIGRILKINGTIATIKGGELAACFGCMNEECKSNGKQFTALNALNLPIEEGQLVEIENKTSTAMLQGITVFLPPVLFFILGYLLTGSLVPTSSDDVRVGIGVAALFLGFFITYWVRNLFPVKGSPTITRILKDYSEAFAIEPLEQQ